MAAFVLKRFLILTIGQVLQKSSENFKPFKNVITPTKLEISGTLKR
jgi:hypothetical protein